MYKKILTENVKYPVSRQVIINKYCTGKTVLDIGCVNHNMDNVDNNNWLHGKIKEVAAELTGVDYLEKEVDQMKAKGFNVICADICKPLIINKTFDVIVVGNLIEHLSNFEGLFINLSKLLAKDGVVLISTANPFFIEQYFYSAFRNHIIVNEEHTCWIDPVILDELIRRFGFETKTVYWIKEKWKLHWVILNGSTYIYNVMTGHWSFGQKRNILEKSLICILKPIFKYLFPNKYINFRKSFSYSDDPDRFIIIRLYSEIFNIFWNIYKLIIPTSSINKHELYFSSITFKKL